MQCRKEILFVEIKIGDPLHGIMLVTDGDIFRG